MNSPRTMPCVLVLPPRSKPPGFQSPRICCCEARDDRVDELPLRRAAAFPRRSASLSSMRCAVDQRGGRSARADRAARHRTPGGRTDRSGARSWISAQRRVADHSSSSCRAGVGGRHRSALVRIHGGPLVHGALAARIAQGADAGQEEIGAADARSRTAASRRGARRRRRRAASRSRRSGVPSARGCAMPSSGSLSSGQAVECASQRPRRSARTRTGARCWRRGR